MAKRSPILGYNHNVRYRGLVFHVQTEDSGVQSPHLFTHLFHHGVIVSTRKLVYDSGSAEDSIKSLMQAQHKAVLKDLKRGQFDDKIDLYLHNTPGLLPRGGAPSEVLELTDPTDPDRAAPSLARSSSPLVATPPVLESADGAAEAELTLAHEPVIPAAKSSRLHTKTAERTSAPTTVRTSLPLADDAPPNPGARTAIPRIDSSPEILIQLELDESEGGGPRSRAARDTEVGSSSEPDDQSDGTPLAPPHRRPGESIPPLPPPLGDRRPSTTAVGAASLPPARPITRPNRPAITPPQVISRPLPPSERRTQETDAIEVYAPAPPSAELPSAPPGDSGAVNTTGERPGQYSQHKRVSERIPADILKDHRRTPPPGMPIPSGLGRPGRHAPGPAATTARATGAQPVIPQPPPRSLDPAAAAPARTRPPTPIRIASPTASNHTGSGVVMTRPAVIVGAPARPSTNTTQRVRKAREDEGRGFGQGLISEKSLDEVILAYLSEDADEK